MYSGQLVLRYDRKREGIQLLGAIYPRNQLLHQTGNGQGLRRLQITAGDHHPSLPIGSGLALRFLADGQPMQFPEVDFPQWFILLRALF